MTATGPVLADHQDEFQCERPSVVSVTPDITASTSFQAPPPRVKADPGPANDSFAALVDSNTERLRKIESGEQIVVGVNRWTETEASPLSTGDGAIQVVDPAIEA